MVKSWRYLFGYIVWRISSCKTGTTVFAKSRTSVSSNSTRWIKMILNMINQRNIGKLDLGQRESVKVENRKCNKIMNLIFLMRI